MNFEFVYSQFLRAIKADCTLYNLTPESAEAMLETWLLQSIASFRFPQIPLTYELKTEEETGVMYYAFVEEITQREINVLIALMKCRWIDFQIATGENFENPYYDSTTRTFSQGALLAQNNRLQENYIEAARVAQKDYSRVDSEGQPRLAQMAW